MDNLRGDKNRRAKIFIRACFFQTEENWKENSMKSRFIGGNQYIQDCTIIDDINMLNVFLFSLSNHDVETRHLQINGYSFAGLFFNVINAYFCYTCCIATRSNEYL